MDKELLLAQYEFGFEMLMGKLKTSARDTVQDLNVIALAYFRKNSKTFSRERDAVTMMLRTQYADNDLATGYFRLLGLTEPISTIPKPLKAWAISLRSMVQRRPVPDFAELMADAEEHSEWRREFPSATDAFEALVTHLATLGL